MVPSQIDEKMELYSPHMFSVLLLLAFYSQLRWSSAVAYGRAEPSGSLSPLGGLQFLSFFPCTTGVASRSCDVFLYPAALLAVKHINLHERTLKFPEYGINVTLNLLERETRGDVAMASYLFYGEVEKILSGLIHGIIGPSSSDMTARIAYIAGNQYSLSEISYGSTDPATDDREQYPLLSTTIPTELFLNLGRLELLRMFNWFRIGVLSSVDDSYNTAAEQLVLLAEKDPRMEVAYYGNFVVNPNSAFSEFHRNNLRIFFGLFDDKQARSVLCQASRYVPGSLTDSSHVWILPSYYDPYWWNLPEEEIQQLPPKERCSNDEMIGILNSILFVDSFNHNLNGSCSNVENLDTGTSFYSELMETTLLQYSGVVDSEITPFLTHSRAANTYDAVWALALAWHETLSELLPNVSSGKANCLLPEKLKNVSFCGKSDQQCFDISRGAYGDILVSQFTDGETWAIGTYSSLEETEFTGVANISLSPFKVFGELGGEMTFLQTRDTFWWKGRGSKPPSDGIEINHSSIPLTTLWVVSALVMASLLFATTLLVLIAILRNTKSMKASSPRLNFIIIIGFMLVMPSSIFLGLSFSRYTYNISIPVTDAFCQLDVWLKGIGYVLAFATLLAKNWRIYRIFFNRKMRRRSNISDNQLCILIVVLTLPMLVLLTVWGVVDPPHSEDGLFKIDRETSLNVTFCTSENIYVWKGTFLAYTTFPILSLVFLGFQNLRIVTLAQTSRVAARFVEEGNGAGRVILLSVTVFMVLSVTFVALERDPMLYTSLFWINVCWSALLPVVLLTVLYLPKFVVLYQDRLEDDRRRTEHRRFTTIRKQMTELDLKARERSAQSRTADALLQQFNPIAIVIGTSTN